MKIKKNIFKIMSTMIHKGKELIRICPTDKGKIEASTTEGRSWITRYSNTSNTGTFEDLNDNGKEILATTTKGLFYSTTEGRSWIRRS
jgi:hypothetical protein